MPDLSNIDRKRLNNHARTNLNQIGASATPKTKSQAFLMGAQIGAVFGIVVAFIVVFLWLWSSSGASEALLAQVGGAVVAGSKEMKYQGEAIPLKHFVDNQQQAANAVAKKLDGVFPPPEHGSELIQHIQPILYTALGIFLLLTMASGLKTLSDHIRTSIVPDHLSGDGDFILCISALSHRKSSYRNYALQQLISREKDLEEYLPQLTLAAQDAKSEALNNLVDRVASRARQKDGNKKRQECVRRAVEILSNGGSLIDAAAVLRQSRNSTVSSMAAKCIELAKQGAPPEETEALRNELQAYLCSC